MAIHVNQRVRMTATFRNEAGALTNPVSVTCRLRSPSGALITPAPTVSNVSVGIYQAEHVVTESGNWKVEFIATGGIDTSKSATFYVEPSQV